MNECHAMVSRRVFVAGGGRVTVIGALDVDTWFTVVRFGDIRIGTLESGLIIVHVVHHLRLLVMFERIGVSEVSLVAWQ